MDSEAVYKEELVIFLSKCLSQNRPFYAFQLPESEEIKIGTQKETKLVSYQHLFELGGKAGFVFAPFHQDEKHLSWFIRSDIFLSEKDITKDSLQVLDALEYNSERRDLNSETHVSSQEEYFEQIKFMIADLQQKKLDKVILSRIQTIDDSGKTNAVDSFLKLSRVYPSAFVFFVVIPSAGTWIGASPETLLIADDSGVKTMALAGTQSLGDRKMEDIQWARKEIEEQAYVSKYIEQILSKHELNSFIRKGPETVRAANIVHLQTSYQLSVVPDFQKLAALVEDLHPTPAVCGLPILQAQKLIRKQENHDREYYAGYLGPIAANGSLSLFVNLRSMKVLKDKMALFVGGGITADSIPEKEWEETCLKAQTLLNVIRK
ncbi:isochorismate synthase [Ancylomarina longa]|uniref:isochorismate synthase n=1 Tax=Ancylomarina longa TaxID=2487017 RepID=A0A434AY71_9BACT|nr:isochorismate synthase [Ancylomarina longa]RUT79519.1 isochorismate synthase [Ancylomarina longa]